jgi:hypothetical protein
MRDTLELMDQLHESWLTTEGRDRWTQTLTHLNDRATVPGYTTGVIIPGYRLGLHCQFANLSSNPDPSRRQWLHLRSLDTSVCRSTFHRLLFRSTHDTESPNTQFLGIGLRTNLQFGGNYLGQGGTLFFKVTSLPLPPSQSCSHQAGLIQFVGKNLSRPV